MFWVWSASPPDDDNAPSHPSLIVTEFLAEYETKVIVQSPYSPDLAPCNFSLKELKAIPAEAYKKCMENWINRWHACIGSKRAYFEGESKDFY